METPKKSFLLNSICSITVHKKERKQVTTPASAKLHAKHPPKKEEKECNAKHPTKGKGV